MIDQDILLWKQVQSNNEEAFRLLFSKYYRELCLFSKQNIVQDMTTAKEIVQDLFAYLWEKRNEITIVVSFKSYLYRSVKLNSIRRIEEDRKHIKLMEGIPDHDSIEFNDTVEFVELQTEILNTIEDLPQQCKKIFKMSRFERMKYSEIAEQLSLSPRTVEVQIHKALHIILQAINKDIVLIPFFIAYFFHYFF